MPQKFDIALRPLHRGEGQAQDLEAKAVCQGHEIIQHLLVGALLSDNALLAHLIPSCLELGLDEAEHLARRL